MPGWRGGGLGWRQSAGWSSSRAGGGVLSFIRPGGEKAGRPPSVPLARLATEAALAWRQSAQGCRGRLGQGNRRAGARLAGELQVQLGAWLRIPVQKCHPFSMAGERGELPGSFSRTGGGRTAQIGLVSLPLRTTHPNLWPLVAHRALWLQGI